MIVIIKVNYKTKLIKVIYLKRTVRKFKNMYKINKQTNKKEKKIDRG